MPIYIYMISYDLNTPGQKYTKLKEKIESLGTWCHYLESTYLLKTHLSVYEVQDALAPCFDSNDKMLVCQVIKPIAGLLTSDNWDWVHSNL